MKLALVILQISALMPSYCVAQETLNCKPRHFTGAVTDLAGRRVPEPLITVESESRRSTFRANKSGKFEVDLVKGFYTFTIQADGFKRLIVTDLQVTDSSLSHTFPLEVGACSDCFWVIADESSSKNQAMYAYEDPAIRAPAITNKPQAEYTEQALIHKFEGTVELEAVLTSSGEVSQIRSLGSVPYGLTESAIAAARKIQFKPAELRGRKASVYYQLEYSFSWRDIDRSFLSRCTQ